MIIILPYRFSSAELFLQPTKFKVKFRKSNLVSELSCVYSVHTNTLSLPLSLYSLFSYLSLSVWFEYVEIVQMNFLCDEF